MMTRIENRENVGTLCVGGDWACAHGDFSGLRDVARRLEALVQPMRGELAELETACLRDPDRAGRLWFTLKPRLERA